MRRRSFFSRIMTTLGKRIMRRRRRRDSQVVGNTNWLKNESGDFEGSARVVLSAVIGTFVDG